MDGAEGDEGEIRCICGIPLDDGFTIQCDNCLIWQHMECVNITTETVPDQYLCERCNPRWLDVEKAVAAQKTRIKGLKLKKKQQQLDKSPTSRKDSVQGLGKAKNELLNETPPRKRDALERSVDNSIESSQLDYSARFVNEGASNARVASKNYRPPSAAASRTSSPGPRPFIIKKTKSLINQYDEYWGKGYMANISPNHFQDDDWKRKSPNHYSRHAQEDDWKNKGPSQYSNHFENEYCCYSFGFAEISDNRWASANVRNSLLEFLDHVPEDLPFAQCHPFLYDAGPLIKDYAADDDAVDLQKDCVQVNDATPDRKIEAPDPNDSYQDLDVAGEANETKKSEKDNGVINVGMAIKIGEIFQANEPADKDDELKKELKVKPENPEINKEEPSSTPMRGGLIQGQSATHESSGIAPNFPVATRNEKEILSDIGSKKGIHNDIKAPVAKIDDITAFNSILRDDTTADPVLVLALDLEDTNVPDSQNADKVVDQTYNDIPIETNKPSLINFEPSTMEKDKIADSTATSTLQTVTCDEILPQVSATLAEIIPESDTKLQVDINIQPEPSIKESILTMLHDDFEFPSINAISETVDALFDSGAPQFGLFATTNIAPRSYISEIKGDFSFVQDLDTKSHTMLSVFPASPTSMILPPFVFECPMYLGALKQPLLLDSRDYSSHDGRFIRSTCKTSEANSQLVTVICISSTDAQKRPKFNDVGIPLLVKQPTEVPMNSRLRLCIFATKHINSSEEILLGPFGGYVHFPCACGKSCETTEVVEKIELHQFGDIDNLPEHTFALLLSARQEERESVLNMADQELTNHDIWAQVEKVGSVLPDEGLKRPRNEDEPRNKDEDNVDAKRIKFDDCIDTEVTNLPLVIYPIVDEPQVEEQEFVDENVKEEEHVFIEPTPVIKVTEPLKEDSPNSTPIRRVSLREFMMQKKQSSANNIHDMDERNAEGKDEIQLIMNFETPVSQGKDPLLDLLVPTTITPSLPNLQPSFESPLPHGDVNQVAGNEESRITSPLIEEHDEVSFVSIEIDDVILEPATGIDNRYSVFVPDAPKASRDSPSPLSDASHHISGDRKLSSGRQHNVFPEGRLSLDRQPSNLSERHLPTEPWDAKRRRSSEESSTRESKRRRSVENSPTRERRPSERSPSRDARLIRSADTSPVLVRSARPSSVGLDPETHNQPIPRSHSTTPYEYATRPYLTRYNHTQREQFRGEPRDDELYRVSSDYRGELPDDPYERFPPPPHRYDPRRDDYRRPPREYSDGPRFDRYSHPRDSEYPPSGSRPPPPNDRFERYSPPPGRFRREEDYKNRPLTNLTPDYNGEVPDSSSSGHPSDFRDRRDYGRPYRGSDRGDTSYRGRGRDR